MPQDRIQPASLEAEQSVLGCMLLSESAVASACAVLEPDDFYTPAHKEIFEAAKSMYAKSAVVDMVTLTSTLRERGSLEGIGGPTYLVELTQLVPGVSNIDAYIKIVENKSTMRRLITSGTEITAIGFDPSQDVTEAVDMAEQAIFNITQKTSTRGFVLLADHLLEAYDSIEQSYSNKQRITGLSTGFTELDNKTSGLHGSELILVAARPSMGKSSFVMNIAVNAALREGAHVAMFTLEDSVSQLVNRMLCCEAMVELQNVRTGNMSDDDWPKLLKAMSAMQDSHIYIDDTPGVTVMDIRSKCRRLKMEKGLDLITIDYLQLMSAPGGSGENRQQQISDMTRALKGLARELDVPVIVLSQLNRSVETRPDHRPMMSDLRESGAIEQDADLVMFLYRDAYYNDTADNMSEVILAKQRNGPTGTVKLLWQGQYTRFMNPATQWQEEAAGGSPF